MPANGGGITSQPNPDFASGGGGMSKSTYAYGGAGAFSLWAGFAQAEMITQQANLTQQLNDMNAEFKDLDAYEAEKYSLEVAARSETETQQVIGAQRAAMAARDVDITYGTAKEIQVESQLAGFLNSLDIQQQGRARALGLRREARNMRIQGMMARLDAEGQATAARTAAIASTIESGAKAYAGGG